jgi:hypothetical protein
LIHDKANCYGSKHDCFATKQTAMVPNTIDSRQSKLLWFQTRLVRDKANCYGSKHDCFATKQVALRQSRSGIGSDHNKLLLKLRIASLEG